MSEMDIYNHTRDVFRHYKLPFDTPPAGAILLEGMG